MRFQRFQRFQEVWRDRFPAAASRAALVLVLGVGLAMAGCVGDTATPEEVIKTVAHDAATGNFQELQTALVGDALSRYGSPAGLAELRASVGKIVAVGTPRLVSHLVGDQGDGNHGDVARSFQTDVAALTPQGARVTVTVDTLCTLGYETFHDAGSKGTCSLDPNNPSGPDICGPDIPPSDYEELVQDCKIAEIKLPTA